MWVYSETKKESAQHTEFLEMEQFLASKMIMKRKLRCLDMWNIKGMLMLYNDGGTWNQIDGTGCPSNTWLDKVSSG